MHGSHHRAGKSCEEAAKYKVLKYMGKLPDDCTDDDFIPFVLESYGAVNSAGLSWLKSLCKELSDEPDSALEHVMNVMSATLQMGNGQVDVSGMISHRAGERAVAESRSMVYQSHVMSSVQRYVSGGIRLNWLSEARRRPGAGQMRQPDVLEERKESNESEITELKTDE